MLDSLGINQNLIYHANSSSRSLELSLLLLVKVDLNDLLDTLAADNSGNTNHDVALAILTLQVAAAGDNTLLVAQY